MSVKAAKKVAKKSRAIAVVKPEIDCVETEGRKLTLVEKPFLAENQILKIFQRTPEKHIYRRPAKGGGQWEYVTGVYVKKVLNYLFGWNWDFESKQFGREGDQVWVLGRLTVRDTKGHAIVREQFGRADVKIKKGTKDPLDYGNDLKAAQTDALKKCASELGIASDVYGKNEFKEVGLDKPTEAPQEEQPQQVVTTGQPECQGCAEPITEEEVKYSVRMYKKQLCRNCQKSTTA